MLFRSLMMGMFLVGCGVHSPSRELPFQVSSSFSPAHQNMVHQGTHTWETALNGYLSFHQDGVGTIQFLPTSISKLASKGRDVHGFKPQGLWPAGDNSDGRMTIGWCERKGAGSARIEVAEDLKDDLFDWVVLHELGHALGLKHSGPGTLMCDLNTCASPQITDQDLEQFRLVWNMPKGSGPQGMME